MTSSDTVKLSLEIPPNLHQRLKRFAMQQSTSVKEVVCAGAKLALAAGDSLKVQRKKPKKAPKPVRAPAAASLASAEPLAASAK